MNYQNIVNQNSNQNIEQNIVNQNSNQNIEQIIEQNIVNQNSNQNSNQSLEQNIVNQNSNQIIEQNIVNQNSNQSLEQNIVNQNSNQNNVNQNVEQIKTDDSEHCDSRDHEKFKKCHLLKKDINKEKAEDDTTINLDLKFQKSSQIDLSEFKVISNIGRGSFGKVLLVENIHTHQRYAAKVSFKKIYPSQEKNDFFNEIELYSKIDHPAILKLHGYSFQDFEGNPYPTMILDYMKNRTLADFLRKKRHSEKFFYEYKSKKYIMLIGIVIGMRYLHSKGIIHRDLKPENILLDENLYPKICDFGISIISDEELIKKQKERQGTPIYLAPEIAFYEAPYSYRVDVYAFSLIAYELITGKEPFPFNEYHSKFNLWKAIEKGVRPDLSIIPDKQVRYLIGKCWSRDPVERPSFAEIYDILFHSSFSFGCNDLESLNYLHYISDECHYFEFTKDNIEEFAEKGNVKAMNLYSTMLLNGINCPKNIEKSRYYMKKAAETNDKYSLYNYANFLLESENILDKRRGFDILRELANDDYEKAMIDCGNCLTFGIGCKIDYEEAIEYYKMASSRKNVEAMFNLGTMYYRGRGTKIDKKKASEYYHLSADLGNKNAMYEYARMLMSGDGIDKDFEKSEDYFNMAAFQNDTGAMMYLGLMYINGNLPFNPDKAKYWFNKCGELNKKEQFCSQVQNVFQTKNGEYDKTAISAFSIQLTLLMPNTNESEEIPSNTNDSSGEIPSMSNNEFLLNIFKIIFMMKNESNNNHPFDDESQTKNIDINKKGRSFSTVYFFQFLVDMIC